MTTQKKSSRAKATTKKSTSKAKVEIKIEPVALDHRDKTAFNCLHVCGQQSRRSAS